MPLTQDIKDFALDLAYSKVGIAMKRAKDAAGAHSGTSESFMMVLQRLS